MRPMLIRCSAPVRRVHHLDERLMRNGPLPGVFMPAEGYRSRLCRNVILLGNPYKWGNKQAKQPSVGWWWGNLTVYWQLVVRSSPRNWLRQQYPPLH